MLQVDRLPSRPWHKRRCTQRQQRQHLSRKAIKHGNVELSVEQLFRLILLAHESRRPLYSTVVDSAVPGAFIAFGVQIQ